MMAFDEVTRALFLPVFSLNKAFMPVELLAAAIFRCEERRPEAAALRAIA